MTMYSPPRRAVWPPERVRHVRGADAAVPVLPRAGAAVGAAAHGLNSYELRWLELSYTMW